ncbi:MAG: hydrogenase, partial [Kordiimonas sp.]
TSDITELHETLGYVLFGVIGLHILVIIFYGVRKQTNLLLPMITGNKMVTENTPHPKIASTTVAFLLMAIVGGLLYYQIF